MTVKSKVNATRGWIETGVLQIGKVAVVKARTDTSESSVASSSWLLSTY